MPTVEQILSDPAASNWLKAVLHSAMDRDPVDAINDAEVLVETLKQYFNKMTVENLLRNSNLARGKNG